MPAYRPLGTFPQYFLADGTVNNGGLIHFYETDLTTPKNTYSDDGLTVPNANPVVLDSSGRPTTDIWGSAAYGVVITDSLGANPRTFNNIQPESGSGSAIPSLVNGEFLTNNGSVLLWEPVAQLPDPTGHSGQILYTDGTLDYWAPPPVVPTPPDPEIVVTSSSFRGGVSSNTSKYFVQTGTASAPAGGSSSATIAITFPTAFTSISHVDVMQTSIAVTSNGAIPCQALSSISTTGFTVKFLVVVDTANPAWNIVSNVPFTWIAHGFLTVP